MKLLNNQNKRIVLIGNGGHASVITEIIHNFKSRIQNVSCEEIINYLKENRELMKINSNVKRKGAT